MRLLGTLLLFGGYVLVYASVANSGVFATEPWAGVFTDAYPVNLQQNAQSAAPGVMPSIQNTPSPVRPRGSTGFVTPPGYGTLSPTFP